MLLTGALGSVEVDIGHFWRVLKHLDVTCGTFVEASSTVPKEGFGNVLTCALGTAEVDSGHCWRVLKDLDVTCGTFVEASSGDCERRVRGYSYRRFQYSVHEISQATCNGPPPLCHLRNVRGSIVGGLRKKGAEMFLTVIPVS